MRSVSVPGKYEGNGPAGIEVSELIKEDAQENEEEWKQSLIGCSVSKVQESRNLDATRQYLLIVIAAVRCEINHNNNSIKEKQISIEVSPADRNFRGARALIR